MFGLPKVLLPIQLRRILKVILWEEEPLFVSFLRKMLLNFWVTRKLLNLSKNIQNLLISPFILIIKRRLRKKSRFKPLKQLKMILKLNKRLNKKLKKSKKQFGNGKDLMLIKPYGWEKKMTSINKIILISTKVSVNSQTLPWTGFISTPTDKSPSPQSSIFPTELQLTFTIVTTLAKINLSSTLEEY